MPESKSLLIMWVMRLVVCALLTKKNGQLFNQKWIKNRNPADIANDGIPAGIVYELLSGSA